MILTEKMGLSIVRIECLPSSLHVSLLDVSLVITFNSCTLSLLYLAVWNAEVLRKYTSFKRDFQHYICIMLNQKCDFSSSYEPVQISIITVMQSLRNQYLLSQFSCAVTSSIS